MNSKIRIEKKIPWLFLEENPPVYPVQRLVVKFARSIRQQLWSVPVVACTKKNAIQLILYGTRGHLTLLWPVYLWKQPAPGDRTTPTVKGGKLHAREFLHHEYGLNFCKVNYSLVRKSLTREHYLHVYLPSRELSIRRLPFRVQRNEILSKKLCLPTEILNPNQMKTKKSTDQLVNHYHLTSCKRTQNLFWNLMSCVDL